jgi:hypothetical protein
VIFRKELVEPAIYPSLQEIAGRTFDRLFAAVGDCLESTSNPSYERRLREQRAVFATVLLPGVGIAGPF